MKHSNANMKPVLVTTAHRGVFFGYAADTTGETIQLVNARMCVYWSADMKGVLGLASVGPSATCRISPPISGELRAVTAVFEVTPEAVTKWEKAPWSK